MSLVNPKRYTSSADVKMRLSGTIIRWKDKAVYASMTDDLKIMVATNPDDGSSTEWVHSSDEDLDISSPPLGWTRMTRHGESHLYYVSRGPNRLQKQGFDYRSGLFYSPEAAQYVGTPIWDGHNISEIMEMVNGRVDNIKKILSVGCGTLSRDFALHPIGKSGRVFLLYHRTNPVAYFRPFEKTFLFRPGRLTKTRKMDLEFILNQPKNIENGPYEIKAA